MSKVIDIAPLFAASGIPSGKIEIVETPGMYPYKEEIEKNWAYYTAVGYRHFKEVLKKENKKIKNIAIVGIGSGVEGIVMLKVFGSELRQLIITDVDEEVTEGAVQNLGALPKEHNVAVFPLVGSFCEPIEQKGCTVDCVHGNIPNLPSTGEEDLNQGAEKGTFLEEESFQKYNPPKKLIAYALGSQYAYLQSASRVLNSGGSVVTELGGRMPWDVIQELFDSCGLRMQEIVVGFKEQTEALIDFQGYHRIEKMFGSIFEFYRYEESKKMLRSKGFENPTWKMSGQEMKQLLAPYAVSAGEALELYSKGIAVGHTLHLLRGQKI